MRNLIVGDIHGCYSKLVKALDNAHFSREHDNLYSVGDFCDRGEENLKVLRFLMALPRFFPVLGNHDLWLMSFLKTGLVDDSWFYYNGGEKTVSEFRALIKSAEEPRIILQWISRIPVVRMTDKYIIVHGGLIGNVEKSFSQPLDIMPKQQKTKAIEMIWDRSFLNKVISNNKTSSDDLEPLARCLKQRIFVGHTPFVEPFYSRAFDLIAIDTGAYMDEQPLVVMDMDSLEYWSDIHSNPQTVTMH